MWFMWSDEFQHRSLLLWLSGPCFHVHQVFWSSVSTHEFVLSCIIPNQYVVFLTDWVWGRIVLWVVCYIGHTCPCFLLLQLL